MWKQSMSRSFQQKEQGIHWEVDPDWGIANEELQRTTR